MVENKVERLTQTREVVIFGTGLFAKYAKYFIENESAGRFSVAAFTAEDKYIEDRNLWGKKVTPFEGLVETFPPDDFDMFVAVGPNKREGLLNGVRADFYKQCKDKGYKLISYVHPSSYVAPDTVRGDNIFMGPMNNVDPFVQIAENVVLWTQNHVGHESTVGKDTFLASGVTISGSCKIGPNCYFGVNSATADGLVIGQNTFVGMGVAITSNTEPGSVYKPEKIIPKPYKTDEMRGF